MTALSNGYAAAIRATRVMLGLNLGLCTAKFVAGCLGHSFALLADGVNNLTDVAVSVTLLVGMRLAQRPADAEHPYGHGRIEQELTRIVSAVILGTGVGIVWEAMRRLDAPGATPEAVVLVVAAVSILVKLFMFAYLRKVARRVGSSALAADAANHKFDVLATTCVIIGTATVRFGGDMFAAADELATIAVGLLMVGAAGREIYSVSSELLDQIPPAAVIDGIRKLAAGYPHIAGVDVVTGRKSGMHYLIDLHLEVDPRMPVIEAHYLGHQVKDWIMAAMPEISDIVIHIEPEAGSRP